MAAKATDKAAPGKPRATKKPAAAATPDKGASAPSSAGAVKDLDKGAAPPDGAAPGGETQLQEGEQCRIQPMGMGRFPEGWQPSAAPDPAQAEQSAPLELADDAAESEQWGMPDITEFPATLTLANATPARVRVLAVKVWVLPWSEQTVQCLTAEQYSWMQRDLSARASSCRWTSTYGLKVTHEQS